MLITQSVDLEVRTCCTCGISFAVPPKWIERRRDDHLTFYCPNGHHLHFPQESDAEKANRLLQQERQKLDQALADARTQREARVRAEADWHKASQSRDRARLKLKNARHRAAAGVCPCCGRTFHQLSEHMADKHPEFQKAAGVKGVRHVVK